MQVIEVEIVNWKKHQPKRKDVKQNSWFRVYHDVFENEDLWHFTREEVCFFFYLLCQASKQNTSRLRLSMDKAMLIGHFKKVTITNALKKLEEIKTVKVKRNEDVTDTLRARTEDVPPELDREIERELEGDSEVPDSDFDFAWEAYPRQVGKGLARERFFKIITSRQESQEFIQAVKNYDAEVKRLNTEEKYIKHMTTFLGTENKHQPWRDFVNYAPGKSDRDKWREEFLARGNA